MQTFEYRVMPAPRRGEKARGARSPEDRFARTVEGEMNRMARDDWEFVRSDTLPSEQRQGLFGGRATVFQTLLVFRRPVPAAVAAATEAPVTHPLSLAPALAPWAPAPPPLAAPPLADSPQPSPIFARRDSSTRPAPVPARPVTIPRAVPRAVPASMLWDEEDGAPPDGPPTDGPPTDGPKHTTERP